MSKNKKNKSTKSEKALDAHAKKTAAEKAAQQKQNEKVQAALDSAVSGETKKSKKSKAAADTSPAASPETQLDTDSTASRGALGSLLGCSVISVMRALGKFGYQFKQIKAILAANNIDAAERTIRGAIRRGKKGESKIAALTLEQLETAFGKVEKAIVVSPAAAEVKQAKAA